jgi:hypothetical protein
MATRRWRRCFSLNFSTRRTKQRRTAVEVGVVDVEVAEAVEVVAVVVEARVGVDAVGAAVR